MFSSCCSERGNSNAVNSLLQYLFLCISLRKTQSFTLGTTSIKIPNIPYTISSPSQILFLNQLPTPDSLLIILLSHIEVSFPYISGSSMLNINAPSNSLNFLSLYHFFHLPHQSKLMVIFSSNLNEI